MHLDQPDYDYELPNQFILEHLHQSFYEHDLEHIQHDLEHIQHDLEHIQHDLEHILQHDLELLHKHFDNFHSTNNVELFYLNHTVNHDHNNHYHLNVKHTHYHHFGNNHTDNHDHNNHNYNDNNYYYYHISSPSGPNLHQQQLRDPRHNRFSGDRIQPRLLRRNRLRCNSSTGNRHMSNLRRRIRLLQHQCGLLCRADLFGRNARC
ncbi:hypothetical protein AYL99_03064 [Fonsecaea erecta]|uniref:Uncharacterized protein n=1 Tax=Fonsecaea erecta TaxID=1367422 RepID=A0A178ZVU7_9EURO|nr:hypothetical protein AYL99_03064 [Fonsecaea erecta]OAP63837.1 hypothetical protein AYL99_03064 [Fonsecaea erecta]